MCMKELLVNIWTAVKIVWRIKKKILNSYLNIGYTNWPRRRKYYWTGKGFRFFWFWQVTKLLFFYCINFLEFAWDLYAFSILVSLIH